MSDTLSAEECNCGSAACRHCNPWVAPDFVRTGLSEEIRNTSRANPRRRREWAEAVERLIAERDQATAALLAARRDADAAQVALRALLEKATTRLEILQGRMAACDDASVMAGRDDMHRLSLFEIPGWIEEQRAALATPERE